MTARIWRVANLPAGSDVQRLRVQVGQLDREVRRLRLQLAAQIEIPFLHVLANRDHIVPEASSAPLVGLVGSADKHELRLDAGHIGLVVGRTAAKTTIPAGSVGNVILSAYRLYQVRSVVHQRRLDGPGIHG